MVCPFPSSVLPSGMKMVVYVVQSANKVHTPATKAGTHGGSRLTSRALIRGPPASGGAVGITRSRARSQPTSSAAAERMVVVHLLTVGQFVQILLMDRSPFRSIAWSHVVKELRGVAGKPHTLHSGGQT